MRVNLPSYQVVGELGLKSILEPLANRYEAGSMTTRVQWCL